MPRPSGLSFVDRLAAHKNGHIFLCQRDGHKPIQQFVVGSKRDGEQVRDAHDAVYHNVHFEAAGLGQRHGLYIGELVEAWNARNERLHARGKLSQKTVRYYQYIGEILVAVFRPRESLYALKPDRISKAVDDIAAVLADDSSGATIIKALSALKTLLTWKAIPAHWKIPIDEIDPQPTEKRDLSIEQTIWLLENADPWSVEELAIAIKMRTGMREVEITALDVVDFDREQRVLSPTLRAKGRRRTARRHIYPIAADMVELLIPWVTDRAANAPLLYLRGGERLQEGSLRRRLVTTCERANERLAALLAAGEIDADEYERKLIDPPLRGLKPIRAEVSTIIEEEFGEAAATKFGGWQNVETMRRWYLKSKQTAKKLEEKRRIAEFLSRIAPLPNRAAVHGIADGAVHDEEHAEAGAYREVLGVSGGVQR